MNRDRSLSPLCVRTRRPAARPAEDRRGTGVVLFLVAACLALSAVTVIGRSHHLSSLRGNSSRMAVRHHAEELVRSVLSELEAGIRSGLSDPASPIYRAIARPVIGKPEPVDLTALVDCPVSRELAAKYHAGKARIESTRIRIDRQASLDGLPYEWEGTLELDATATVSSPLGPDVRTAMREARALRITLSAPPRPFDRFGFYTNDVASFMDPVRVDELRAQLLGRLAQLRQRVAARAEQRTGEGREALLAFLDGLPSAEQLDRTAPRLTGAGTLECMYGLVTHEDRFRFDQLDLVTSLTAAVQRADQALVRVAAAPDDQVSEVAGEASSQVTDALWGIRAFLDYFTLVRTGPGAERSDLDALSKKLTAEYLSRRASYVIHEDPSGREAAQTLVLRQVERAGRRGVMLLHNPTQVLRLDRPLPGQVVLIVGKGGVTLDGGGAGAGPRSRLTVISTGGPVTIKGRSRAHIIALPGATVTLEPGSVLRGGLTLVRPTTGHRLQGTLVREDRYATGVSGENGEEDDPARTFCVTLSPRTLYRRLML